MSEFIEIDNNDHEKEWIQLDAIESIIMPTEIRHRHFGSVVLSSGRRIEFSDPDQAERLMESIQVSGVGANSHLRTILEITTQVESNTSRLQLFVDTFNL